MTSRVTPTRAWLGPGHASVHYEARAIDCAQYRPWHMPSVGLGMTLHHPARIWYGEETIRVWFVTFRRLK